MTNGTFEAGEGDAVRNFVEKPRGDGSWINGGFFVCQPKVFDYIREGDRTVLERAPLQDLARDGQLYTYRHRGFWKCMGTLRDKVELNQMWQEGKAPWKVW